MQGRTRRGVSVSNKYSGSKASPNQLQRNKSNKPKASPNQLQKNKSNKNLNIFDKGKTPKGNTPKGKKEKVNKPTPKTGGSPNQKLKEEKRKNINRPGKNDNKIPTGVNRPGTDSKKPKSKIKSLTTDYIKQNLTFGPILGPSFFLTKNLYEQYLKKKKA